MGDERWDEPTEVQDFNDAYAPAPPTAPGAIGASSRSTWPTTIGVISIVLGVMGMAGGAIGIVSILVLPQLFARQAQMAPMPPSVIAAGISSSIVSTLLALLLLVAGIGMVRRRRWSIGATRTWAIIKIVVAVAGVGVAWWMRSVTPQPTTTTGGAAPPAMTSALQAVSLLIGLMWSLAWPIVCMAWLGRAASRAEYETWP